MWVWVVRGGGGDIVDRWFISEVDKCLLFLVVTRQGVTRFGA